MGALSCSCTFPRINCPLECVQACDACRVARDAEIRATMTEANGDVEIQRVDKERIRKERDAARVEIQRLRGELEEARGLLEERVIRETCIPCGRCITCRTLYFLSRIAPTPAESTPVQATPEGALRNVMAGRLPWQPAPPDDIRARLDRLEAKVELNAALCKAATKCTEVGLANVAAALEAKDSDRCARADCGRPRRCGGHGGHHVFVAALEAKGEPGTVLCDEHGREDCGRPVHAKGAKP